MRWIIDTFTACQMTGLLTPTRGWVCKGLGLYRTDEGFWWLVHLNSGHGVVRLGKDPEHSRNPLSDVLLIADEIADAADWTFGSLDGWTNRNPDLPAKLSAIAARYPGLVESPARHHRMEDLGEKVSATRRADEDMSEAARLVGFKL